MRTSAVLSVVIMMLLAAAPLGLRSAAYGSQAAPAGENRPVPVFRTIEVMEVFFEPLYGDLTHAIAKAPVDRDEWRAVLTPVMKLAELHNLLFFRTHEEYTQQPDWPRQVAANRARLLNLVQAVRDQDYPLVRKHYEAATLGCNTCHKEFSTVPVLLKPYDPVIVR